MFVFATAACSAPAAPDPALEAAADRSATMDGITYSAEGAEYRRGESAIIVLRNDTEDLVIGYNLCRSARETRAEGGWHRFEPLRMCTEAFYPLGPGENAVFQEAVTDEWQPGSHRMITRILVSGQQTKEITTPAFLVTD